MVGIPNPRAAGRQLPARDVGRHAPARGDRDRDGQQPGRDHRRRADHRARRHRAGAGARGAGGGPGRDRRGDGADHPRPRRDRRARRPGLRDVRRASWSRRAPSTTSSTTRGCRTRSACWAACRGSTRPAGERLTPIVGSPPSLLNLPPGCPFTPRCPLAQDICEQTSRTCSSPTARPTSPPATSTSGWSA